jgi:RNA polymerase sigma factor (sigma-70 family)
METLGDTKYELTDAWQKFRKGDHAMLGEVFEDLYQELYYYGLKLVPLPDLVKDTIQDMFVDVWFRRQKMKEVRNIKAYFFVSVRRELLKRIKKLRQESALENGFYEPFEFSKEDFIVKEEVDSELTRTLVQSLDKLTGRQREVVLLRFNHELEFHEIAQVLEMNIQSVRNLLFRALESIRNNMRGLNVEGASDIEVFLFGLFQKKNVNFSQKK